MYMYVCMYMYIYPYISILLADQVFKTKYLRTKEIAIKFLSELMENIIVQEGGLMLNKEFMALVIFLD